MSARPKQMHVLQLQPRICLRQICAMGAVARSPRFLRASQDPDDLARLHSNVAGVKSGDGGAAMRHTMGCKLGARAEIFARRSGVVSITSAGKARS